MKLTVESKSFRAIVRDVCRIIKPNNPSLLLQHLKLEATESGHIIVSGTDYERELQALAEGKVHHPGAITLPGKPFLDIVSGLSGETLTIESKNHKNSTVYSGGSRYKLNGFDPADFPKFSWNEAEFCLPAFSDQLKKAIERISFAISSNEQRPSLCGALFSARGGLLLIEATDEHRFASAYVSDLLPNDIEFQAIVPKETVIEMGKLLTSEHSPVWIQANETRVALATERYRFFFHSIPGRFPNVDKLFDAARPIHVRIEREALINSVKRLDGITDPDIHRLQMKAEGDSLTLWAKNTALGEGEEVLSLKEPVEPIETFIHARQLLEVLQAMDSDSVCLMFESGDRPILIEPNWGEDYEMILMPLTPW